MPISDTYTSRELLAKRDGLTIYGQLFLPVAATPDEALPCVVCAPGFAANYLSMMPFAWALAERGFAAYCFDFCGGGYAVKSEGSPLETTMLSERDDLLAVMEALAQAEEVDESRLYLLGDGLGALAATLVANERPEEVAGLALLHPTFNLHEQTRKLFPTKKNIPASYRHLGMRVGRTFGEVAWDTNPYAYLSAFASPVLIVHGSEDTAVPLDCSRRATQAFADCTLHVIPGGRHALRGPQQAEAIEAVTDFLLDCELA